VKIDQIVVALGLAALMLAPASAAGANRIETTLSRYAAANPETGALVLRLDGTAVTQIASYKPDSPRIPASTMKLATGAGSLLSLGSDFRFSTRVYTNTGASLRGGVLRGPVYLQGSGDPLLATGRYSKTHLGGRGTTVVKLARPLRRHGIRRIKGPIVADETVFDRRRTGLRWLSHYTLYSPPLGGLVTNQAYAGNAQVRYSSQPALASGVRLRTSLRAIGVATPGKVRHGRTPRKARLLANAKSAPLRVIVQNMNKSSDNHIAETLTKSVGAYAAGSGSSAAGATQIASALSRRGMITSRDRIADGSGLSRANRLSASSLVRLLTQAENEPGWGKALIASLPRGGEGTLTRRFRGSSGPRVRAKTGYINGASTLAGRVVSKRGKVYIFAILMNGGALNLTDARSTQDRVVALLAAGVADSA